MTLARLSLGKQGEDEAARFLQSRGYTLLARNLRTPVGEIDLIVRDRQHIIFVEVKTRRTLAFGLPQEAVGVRKQRQIIRTAEWYLLVHPQRLQPRFDVIAVFTGTVPPQIEHIPDAFTL